MQKFVLATLVILSSTVLIAESVSPGPQVSPSPAHSPAPDKSHVKALMHEIFAHLLILRQYAVTDTKFEDPKNEEVIKKELGELAKLAKQGLHENDLQKANFRFSRRVLEEHIQETKRVFEKGNKTYARWSLQSTTSICMSCHTQLPAQGIPSIQLEDDSDKFNPFERAEFQFATRNFDKSLAIYNSILANFSKVTTSHQQAEISLDRKLAIYLRIKRDIPATIATLEIDAKNKNLPESILNNVKAWIKELNNRKYKDLPNPQKITPSELRKFTKGILESQKLSISDMSNDPQSAKYLVLSGILYEYLNTHPESEITPEIFYWLAIADRTLSNNFFFSLADMYLKECIIKFPQSKIAKSCYKEYELNTTVAYSGSSGTNLPYDVRQELENLKSLLKPKAVGGPR